ncbi:Synaptotagmin-15 [Folsomia candida]|uniref:Synaptotagmin-15 n=2 Tax=Folsomia candida TaxID=158441 RepID=A0A226EYM2_FOLCA|nr:Synaptotagmin-15 [Folsomia candida]
MMMYENNHHSGAVRQTSVPPTNNAPSSLPTTPNFVRKFQSNFRPLDLRKITLYGSQSISIEETASASSTSISQSSSSQENSPRDRKFVSSSFHSNSHDSFMLKRQSSQNRLRESLLSSLLSPRTKEIEFHVPQTLSPLTPTFGRKGINSGESSPGSLSGSRSETEPSNSRTNTPSPIFFSRSSAADSSGAGCLGGLNPELYKSTPETEDDEVDYPANHFGRVWYALEYEMMSERLLVTLIKARNLSEARSHGGSSAASSSLSPFVRITLFPDERRTLQTKPKKATRNPQFNETFGFQVSLSSLKERSLKLCFYDSDDGSKRHPMIGYITQPLKDIDWSFGKQVFKEDLVREIGELSPSSEVSVSLCYNGNISRLTVIVFEAKGIKSKESASGLYAKISLSQNTKVLKTKKTDTVMLLGCRASFNESFNFKLGPEMLDTTSVTIQFMYSQPGYNKDQSAGRIVLGSFMFARGRGLDHWTEVLSKQKEQIQYWHPINE